jgi:hypothetical protein
VDTVTGQAIRLATSGLPRSDPNSEQPAATLLHLIDQKRLQHQARERAAQRLLAVIEVVLEVIALVLDGVEGLVCDSPACEGYSYRGHQLESGTGTDWRVFRWTFFRPACAFFAAMPSGL